MHKLGSGGPHSFQLYSLAGAAPRPAAAQTAANPSCPSRSLARQPLASTPAMREAGGVAALAARPVPLPPAAAAAPPRHRAAAAPPAADPARLQFREALAGLACSDLQQQSVFAAEALLAGADAALCDWAAREALRPADLAAAPAASRRLRYRCALRTQH